jgi:hypothetical protein
MMGYYDMQQQHTPLQNPQQWGSINPQFAYAQGFGQLGLGQGGLGQTGFGQAAYGQQNGQYGQQFGQSNIGAWGAGTGWGQQPGWNQSQRQLSQHEVGDVVRQLVPLLPQILAQAQQQPQAAFGYGGGQGQFPRLLTQQDVNEVVRQIIPILPHVAGILQGQGPLQAAAIYGGQGSQGGAFAQHPFGQQGQQQPFGLQGAQPFGQQGWPNALSAFGGSQTYGSNAYGSNAFGSNAWGQPQRQLMTDQDVSEVVRQLLGVIPQVVGNLRSFNQQRVN